ncbi:damage-control phosphatase ARMT1 family protein [Streptomyces sp. NPDC059896]|uniref:damage-control phosphatase ARMT1 family protein n=1 Tax=Streptomyces sp. NPDC059896 TaxID=3346993 RepID=UPI0036656210
MRTADDTAPPTVDDAPVILGDEPGSFARGVLTDRHPALIQQVRDAFPCTPAQHRALDALLRSVTDGVMEPLAPDAHDRAQWEIWGRDDAGGSWFGRSWFDVPFLWAESYFYRVLLDAMGYFGDGPWRGVDPFAPFKDAELRGPAVDDELAALDALAGRPADERALALAHASLWGNRADLGFRIASGAVAADSGTDPRLVADDGPLLWSLLPVGAAGTVHLIADNAGRELIPDLVLLDHLLHTERASRAVLHVKPYPYYVSDATMTDVIEGLRRLRAASGYAAGTGERLRAAMADGRLAVRAHSFFSAPLPYSAMPGDLRRELAGATVTILKGDLNYRRLVGDRYWGPTSSFAGRTAYFPGPVAALRTLKSDVIVGLDARTLDGLEASGKPWRTSGTHALVQARR